VLIWRFSSEKKQVKLHNNLLHYSKVLVKNKIKQVATFVSNEHETKKLNGGVYEHLFYPNGEFSALLF